MLEVNSISKSSNQRVKSSFDIGLSLLMTPVLPFLFIIQKAPLSFIKNWFLVLIQQKTWVGFAPANNTSVPMKLPRLKPSVLHPLSHLSALSRTDDNIQKLNIVYAKDYRLSNDLGIVLKNIRKLGGES
jgi:hypothetical protein